MKRLIKKAEKELMEAGFNVVLPSGYLDLIAWDLNFFRLIKLAKTKNNLFPVNIAKRLSGIIVPPNCRREIWLCTKRKFVKYVIDSDERGL